MSIIDPPSPGGWLRTFGIRVAKGLVIGLIGGGTALGSLTLYGSFQGAQASLICEGQLASATKDTVTYSCLNPLPENWTGAILATPQNGVQLVSTPAPRTRLNICTAATATTACAGTAAGANVGSGIQLYGSKNRWLALSNTGGMVTQTPQILAPRNYTNGTAKRYLNFTFVNGSGATTNGLAAATARVEIRPCNLSGVGC